MNSSVKKKAFELCFRNYMCACLPESLRCLFSLLQEKTLDNKSTKGSEENWSLLFIVGKSHYQAENREKNEKKKLTKNKNPVSRWICSCVLNNEES